MNKEKEKRAEKRAFSSSPSEFCLFRLSNLLTGEFEFSHSQFHILNGISHSFDKTLIESIIQDNINPIERVQQSAFLLTEVIHQKK